MTAAELAEAVKDAINAAEFSVEFTATRVYVPLFKIEDMETLHVTIVPRDLEISLATRRDNRSTTGVDVAVQQRLSATSNTALDALVALVEDIAQHMTRRDVSTARWESTEVRPLYSPDELRERRQFTSVIRLTYIEDLEA